MHMQVMHLLAPLITRVRQHSKSASGIRTAALLQCQLRRQHHHASHQTHVFSLQMRHRRDMQLGNHQKVNRCPRMDVVKRIEFIVLINEFGRYLSGHDFAEEAVRVMPHNVFDH